MTQKMANPANDRKAAPETEAIDDSRLKKLYEA